MVSLQQMRREYRLKLPAIFSHLDRLHLTASTPAASTSNIGELAESFPLTSAKKLVRAIEGVKCPSNPIRVGVVFSGGQAPGGHNVIAGLWDALKALHSSNSLIGFLDGPSGILQNQTKLLTEEAIAPYRNQGGFDLIGSGRTKIESPEQFEAALKTVQSNALDGLVIIGGDDSNTNAAFLAEFFLNRGCPTKVIGVPKTIDGDLKNTAVATSFGFDTACKVYSELIGNISRDVLSAKKYYHFVKLMGRTASHIALECALATHPNFCLIGEDVAAQKKSLAAIVQEICDLICQRASLGKNYGVILLPEGLIEFIPEMGVLISELNLLSTLQKEEVIAKLTQPSRECFLSLPEKIQKQLLLDRDPHGNVQLSLIETEGLLIEQIAAELALRQTQGSYKGKFSPLHHFFGYEGRSAFPSNFDAHYCYALGFTTALLIDRGFTGYMSFVDQLHLPVSQWHCGGIPIVQLMNLEMRRGKSKPVIKKALVDLNGQPFLTLQANQAKWALEDCYCFPGPMQFYGDPSLSDATPITLQLERS